MRTGVFGQTDSRAATLAILGAIRSVLLYYGADRRAELSQELGELMLKVARRDGAITSKPEHRQ